MLPNALAIGVEYELFFHLSPKELKCFGEANRLKERRKDYDMYVQASYFYEALSTVMANSFGKGHHKWRDKPYMEEQEEKNMSDEDKANANGMAIMKNLELSMTMFNATHGIEKK